MSSQRPRRRRPDDDDEDGGGRSLPMVPIFAAVIVAGLGIGALLSAFAARQSPAPAPSGSPLVVTYTPTPIGNAAPAAPAAGASVAAAPSPATARSAQPTTAPSSPPASASPSTVPSRRPSVKPEASATEKPTPSPSPAPTLAVPRSPQIRPPATITLRPVESPSFVPTPVLATVRPSPAPPARIAQSSTVPSANPAAGAESLARRYLEAIAHGDEASAYQALGGSGRLSESQYLDPTMRITSLTSSRAPNGLTKIEAEITTAKGEYFSTFTVQDTARGTIITDHTIIPVGGTTAR